MVKREKSMRKRVGHRERGEEKMVDLAEGAHLSNGESIEAWKESGEEWEEVKGTNVEGH